MKGKNKLVPKLLGITKDSMVRLDAKTKEIVQKWPLERVLRWAASSNSFTLDFGDYSHSYYSVQTTEGEQISQLIAGYIDIILKKKKDKDHFGIEGDEESTMYEDSVSPAKATIIQHQSSKIGHASTSSVAIPAVLRPGGGGESQFTTGSMQRAQFTQVSNTAHTGYSAHAGMNAQYQGLNQSQRALWGTIDTSITAVTNAQSHLERKADLSDVGTDVASMKWRRDQEDISKQNVDAQLSAMSAATAQVVTLTSGDVDEPDFAAVGSAVAAISSNIGEFSKDMQMLAALQDEASDGDRLMDAARKLAGAFTDMLMAAQPGSQEHRETSFPRQNMLSAASRIGEASHDIMKHIGQEDDVDRRFQDILLSLAKAIANATAALVLKAKEVAGCTDDQILQNNVIGAATQCALATSQLVACTKVVAPTIHNPECQYQLVDAAMVVAKSVEMVVAHSKAACNNEHLLDDLGRSAQHVSDTLNDLLQNIKHGTHDEMKEDTVDAIMVATDKLSNSLGDTPEMVRQAKLLAQATSQLVNALKGEAESDSDSESQRKLLAAAKILADATANMVEAAKGCASHPQDAVHQAHLREAAEQLRTATTAATANSGRRKVVAQLEAAARNAATAATQLINISQSATKHNRNNATQTQLLQECKHVADDMIPRLVHGIKGTMANPNNMSLQLVLINAALDMIEPGSKLVSVAKAATPTISDQSIQMALTNSSKILAAALAGLRVAAGKSRESCGSTDVDGAIEQIGELHRELSDLNAAAAARQLRPLPGETADSCAMQLGMTSKTVGTSMAQLLTAAAQGNENYTGLAARDTSNALRVLTQTVRGVAATTDNSTLQRSIIESALEVMARSQALITEAKRAVRNPKDPDNQARLALVAKAVSQALNNCVNCLPGLKEVDHAVKHLTVVNRKLNPPVFVPTNRPFQEIQTQLNNSAVGLNQAASDVVTSSRGSPHEIASSTTHFSKAYEDFVDSGLTFASASRSTETQNQVVSGLRSVSMRSSKLLMSTKTILADPNAPNAKNLLAQAARTVTESINHLINVCTTSAPGQKECDNALRQIQMMRNVVMNPTEPISDAPYFECLDGVMERSTALAEAMTGITSNAKQGELDQFCVSVRNFANAICGLTESAAQTAYLVGIADPASQPGHVGLVDQSQFARANQAIQMACQNLTNPAATQKQDFKAVVLNAATIVAKHTSNLCMTCRQASMKTNNPVAKRHFVQSAKDVANSTANLVKEIKVLDNAFTDENRQHCADAAIPLIEAVEELNTYAASPEFASVPATISPQARRAQEPITSSGIAMIDGACNMVQAAKQLAAKPRDPGTYQLYSTHSKQVSDAIKSLLASIKTRSPGQKECEEAMMKIGDTIKELDRASLAAIGQNLQQCTDNSLQGFQDQLLNSASQLSKLINPVSQAGLQEAEKLGHLVSTMADYMGSLVYGSVGIASKTMNSKRQMALLDQTKTVAESVMQLVSITKEAGGNPRAVNTHQSVKEAAESTSESLHELIQTLEEVASAAGIVSAMVEDISKSLNKTEKRMSPVDGMMFVDYQTSMVRLAKQIAHTTQEMVSKCNTNMSELGGLANNLTHTFGQLSKELRGVVSTCPSEEVCNNVRSAVQDLGKRCIDLVQDGGRVQSNPTDAFSKRDLAEHAKQVSHNVLRVLSALQAGSRGTQACINAASTVSGIIGDLDTTIMFATSGTLNADGEEVFADHRENILKTAKSLVEDTKTLVAGAASNQEQLAMAAQSAVMTITRLADSVKQGAASLGADQPEAQVLLINAVKDVATALGDLISATKYASGKTPKDPAMGTLMDSAKIMVTNVKSLLETVKTVEDEAARGTRALESSIEAIGQEIRHYVSSDHVEQTVEAEQLIRSTKPLTIATARAVAAGNSGKQDDVIVVANMGRKAIHDVLAAAKGAAYGTEDVHIRQRALEGGKICAQSYRELLEQVQRTIIKPSMENRQRLAVLSKKVANAVTELVHSAEAIKEISPVPSGMDWVDPDDPIIVAEAQLHGAANSIEAAARKLEQLQPRKLDKQADENLSFEEQIVEAAKSIAAATGALIKAATAAQRELVAQGKVGAYASEHEEDSQWSQGLIYAAKEVAAATHSLCDAANALGQGHASEEKLISSAKLVASNTAKLLVACRVKANPDSVAMRRLQGAGNAVKRATDALVKAALLTSQSGYYNEENIQIDVNQQMVGGMAQIINAHEDILKKEKELDVARRRLETIYKAKYNKDTTTSGDEDNDSSASNF